MRAAGVPLETLGPAARGYIADGLASGAIALGPDSPLRTVAKGQRRDDEHREQRALIEWRNRVLDRVSHLRWLAAIPNGGARSKRAAGRAKAEGVAAGIPDLVLPVPCWAVESGPGTVDTTHYCGLWLELKTTTGRRSPAQREWHAHLRQSGYAVHLCRSAAEARAVLCAYLGVDDPEPETLEDAR